MFCPSCKHENRSGRKFCVHCGAGLESSCPSCGARAEPGEPFCGECGKSLAGLSTPTAPPDPRSYTPKHLVEKILTSRAALEGERKQVTILFADVRESTNLAEQVGPEVNQIIDRVASNEHTLEERIGDMRAVMDAAGSERATVYGWSEGGPMCLMFSATYPKRVSSLGLYGTFASIKDPPWSLSNEEWEQKLAIWTDHWGEGNLVEFNAPSLRNDPAVREMVGEFERLCASPGKLPVRVLDHQHAALAVNVQSYVHFHRARPPCLIGTPPR